MVHFGNHLLDHLSGANVFNIFHTIGSAGGLYTLLAPYFVAFSQFTMGRDLGMRSRAVRSDGCQCRPQRPDNETHLAHFTDTFYEINGVALTLQQQVQLATATNRRYTLITCDDQNRTAAKRGRRILQAHWHLLSSGIRTAEAVLPAAAGDARLLPPAGLQPHPYGDAGTHRPGGTGHRPLPARYPSPALTTRRFPNMCKFSPEAASWKRWPGNSSSGTMTRWT
jgi:hypothetical protein